VSQYQSSHRLTSEAGFTLIEVLLASFIFMSVVTISVGSFSNQISLQSSTLAQRSVQQTSQAIIETISRDFRSFEAFDIRGSGSTCTLGAGIECGDEIRFDPPGGGGFKTYRFQGDVVELNPPGGGGWSELNNPAVVTVTDFSVEGIEPDPVPTNQTGQPFVVIHLSVQTIPTGRVEDEAQLTTRTMVTSRLFEKYTETPPN